MSSSDTPTRSFVLTPTGRIAPQPWMIRPDTVAVMRALAAGGRDPRFIGGCVRDAIAGQPVTDIDIATPEPPERVVELLTEAGIRAVPTGLKHGTITAVLNHHPFEITTLRVDVETDGRHAVVAFTDDWVADAARRDFTINALSSTLDGDVYDPFGGIDDLARGWVRFVGNAHDRVSEDFLRILRFFRFYARFGRPPVDREALEACRNLAPRLPELSGERVRAELFKILLAPNPADTFVLMQGTRVLDHLLTEATDISRLRAAAWLDSRAVRIDSLVPDPLRRLCALLHVETDAAETLAERLRLSKRERHRFIAMCTPSFTVDSASTEAEWRTLAYRHGIETVRDVAVLTWAGERALEPRQPRAKTEGWIGLLENLDAWKPRRFPLSGADALKLGLEPGPQIGKLLGAVESWWIEGGFGADRRECLEHLEFLASCGTDGKED